MAHYAFLDENNLVTQVIVGRDEDDLAEGITDWETYYGQRLGQVCKRTSYNSIGGENPHVGTPYRYNYAGIGFTFDPDKGTDGAFIPPKPFESWVLDEATCLWFAPVAYPEDGESYTWDEEAGDWVTVPEISEV